MSFIIRTKYLYNWVVEADGGPVYLYKIRIWVVNGCVRNLGEWLHLIILHLEFLYMKGSSPYLDTYIIQNRLYIIHSEQSTFLNRHDQFWKPNKKSVQTSKSESWLSCLKCRDASCPDMDVQLCGHMHLSPMSSAYSSPNSNGWDSPEQELLRDRAWPLLLPGPEIARQRGASQLGGPREAYL